MTLNNAFLFVHARLWVGGGLGVLEGGGVSQWYSRYFQDDLMRLGMKMFHPQPCSLVICEAVNAGKQTEQQRSFTCRLRVRLVCLKDLGYLMILFNSDPYIRIVIEVAL